ncbi:hypothetical protein AGR4C_Lc90205 [Agrobacterium tumefaciens str. Kerr 14]|uniref:Uncharacterized protein n=1 Tax=Agrobacterium tumefaciens str. Kerr 14 TaxID=1183424 RepID=A0A1S7S853_AGRTU|nr:hypothetical protein AGR4C_Lc90205 [Agrobacterium tumefaciens str. Kerr 14]
MPNPCCPPSPTLFFRSIDKRGDGKDQLGALPHLNANEIENAQNKCIQLLHSLLQIMNPSWNAKIPHL